jgi:hypothetical protein
MVPGQTFRQLKPNSGRMNGTHALGRKEISRGLHLNAQKNRNQIEDGQKL